MYVFMHVYIRMLRLFVQLLYVITLSLRYKNNGIAS